MTKLQQQYRAWRQTPESEGVMGHFRRLAQEAADQHRPFRLKALAERVRDEAGFKLNNIYIAYIARELLRELPGLEKFIETRKTSAERSPFPPEWMGRVKSPRLIPTHAMESRHGRRV
jgi:hypothetical protein